jgi:G:T/U-mismatch repair DNA glycosylase/8-oxo-dGTP pyrophosphatase MutT (NUDIX family)
MPGRTISRWGRPPPKPRKRRGRSTDPTPSDVPDVLAAGLRVVFVGINPGRVSAAAHAHFANPRNDFWRLLYAACFTSRLYDPQEQFSLLDVGIGVTNAAYRTTPGSGDLRRGDFAGSEQRLEGIARDLRPGWLGFVGKEAYRGAFGGRPAMGVQERTLVDTRLFVLPSTSPANAAVPWGERLVWFQELAGRATGDPLRQATRALVLDPAGRTLLTRFDFRDGPVWAPPGGGIEAGESDEQAIRREVREELGLRECEVGPLLWTRTHRFADMAGWGGQTERHYLVRTPHFEPRPEIDIAAEKIAEIRWFAPEELDGVVTAPRRLPRLVRDLLDRGPPADPPDAGV